MSADTSKKNVLNESLDQKVSTGGLKENLSKKPLEKSWSSFAIFDFVKSVNDYKFTLKNFGYLFKRVLVILLVGTVSLFVGALVYGFVIELMNN